MNELLLIKIFKIFSQSLPYILIFIIGFLAARLERKCLIIARIKDLCETERNDWCNTHCLHPEEFCEKRYCYPIRPHTDVINIIEEKTK